VGNDKRRERRVLVEWRLPGVFGKRFEFPRVGDDNVIGGKCGRWCDGRGLPG
jgi:hypothetical protein